VQSVKHALSDHLVQPHDGLVSTSSADSQSSASARDAPHISRLALNPEQQLGRSRRPKIAHRKSAVSCAQATPAGLPCAMPGIGLEIDGAIQQAPHPARHSKVWAHVIRDTLIVRLWKNKLWRVLRQSNQPVKQPMTPATIRRTLGQDATAVLT